METRKESSLKKKFKRFKKALTKSKDKNKEIHLEGDEFYESVSSYKSSASEYYDPSSTSELNKSTSEYSDHSMHETRSLGSLGNYHTSHTEIFLEETKRELRRSLSEPLFNKEQYSITSKKCFSDFKNFFTFDRKVNINFFQTDAWQVMKTFEEEISGKKVISENIAYLENFANYLIDIKQADINKLYCIAMLLNLDSEDGENEYKKILTDMRDKNEDLKNEKAQDAFTKLAISIFNLLRIKIEHTSDTVKLNKILKSIYKNANVQSQKNQEPVSQKKEDQLSVLDQTKKEKTKLIKQEKHGVTIVSNPIFGKQYEINRLYRSITDKQKPKIVMGKDFERKFK